MAGKLSNASLFKSLSSDGIEEIDRLSTDVEVEAGYVLAREGSIGREFGVILDGTASVSIDGVEVATLRAGDHYGEVALMAELGQGFRRSATVVATSKMTVAVMSISEFSTFLSEFPTLGARLKAEAKGRLEANENR
jgi:CRP/FNR family transcriptional regulator, cyclic AMP receptor protein